MTITVVPLTETHILAAEEELGSRFVESFRTFLLKNKWLIMTDEPGAPHFQIVPYSTFLKNYTNVRIGVGVLSAERV